MYIVIDFMLSNVTHLTIGQNRLEYARIGIWSIQYFIELICVTPTNLTKWTMHMMGIFFDMLSMFTVYEQIICK